LLKAVLVLRFIRNQIAKVSTYYKRLISCLILAQPKPMGRSLLIALIPTKTSKQHPFIQTFLENIFAKFNKVGF
jgi:hypothetical protein